jgi:type II secretory ATPase GspE/PulE/Tfp pilus assembly ATPase PilB-like protein
MHNASSREISEQAKKEGMKTLLDDALTKAAEGITTLEEVLRVVSTIG